jgi:hypothetical protein
MAEKNYRQKQKGKSKTHTRLFYLTRLRKSLTSFNEDFENLIKLFERQFQMIEERRAKAQEYKKKSKANNLNNLNDLK